MSEHQRKAAVHALQGNLDVYRVIICADALTSTTSNRVSYIDVQTHWSVPGALAGQAVPAQAHYDLIGRGNYEVRLVWVDANGALHPAGGGEPDRVTVDGHSHFAAKALRLPPISGDYDLSMEWRRADGGAAWSRSSARHPIQVEYQSPPPTTH